jgi:hypothetical protein
VDAHAVLQESCLAFPWNWSAWLDLAEICVGGGGGGGSAAAGAPLAASAVPEGFNGQDAAAAAFPPSLGAGAAPEDACLAVALRGPAPWTRKLFVAHALVRLRGTTLEGVGATSRVDR